METEQIAKRRLEISRGIKGGKSGIDRAYEDQKSKGVIRGFAVMTQGNVKDIRGWEIDTTTLDQIVTAGNAHANLGLKSRFGHPNMSTTALGTFLGRVKNFYRDGNIARADLYISRTAYDTPEGDLASYVLDLAEKDPEAFGTSVVLGDYELVFRINTDGTPQKDEKGNDLPPLLRVQSLLAVDVVDEPAANNSLFGKFFNDSIQLSAKATDFLDKLLTNPDALEYVISFLERYRISRVEIDQTEKENKKGRETSTKEVRMPVEMKDLTVDQLRKERPDLVTALHQDAVKEERSRALAIVKNAHTEFAGMGMEAIVEESLESGKIIDASLSAMRKKRLDDLSTEGNKAPGADQEGTDKKTHLERAKEYQKEHKGTLQAALSATAPEREKK